MGQRIYREFTGGDVFSSLVIEGVILELVAEASRATANESTPAGPCWLKQARDLIHDSCSDPLTLSSIARTVGVHPSHLARTFRRHYGSSIGDYLRRLRIERASRELTDTSHSLAQISLHTGFFDQSHFSRVFKLHSGLTPAQYRAAARSSRTTPHLPS
jgi:AraC family transcriptional regulator